MRFRHVDPNEPGRRQLDNSPKDSFRIRLNGQRIKAAIEKYKPKAEKLTATVGSFIEEEKKTSLTWR